jgi:hypothetical protein
MKKVLFYFCLLFAFSNSYSQELPFKTPDYKMIETVTKDSTSEYYYPKLMSRFLDCDSTLKLQDYRCLYFGYIYQKDYQPYWQSTQENELIKYYQSNKIKEKDYDKIINLTTLSINEFPFDLRQMNYLSYIYYLKGDNQMQQKVSRKFGGIIDAIMTSGDGKTCETAFHVISVGHEYVLLNLFEFEFESQSLTGNCDYMALEKDDRNIEGIYFNIAKLFEKNKLNLENTK